LPEFSNTMSRVISFPTSTKPIFTKGSNAIVDLAIYAKSGTLIS
jgi:hypothetical protein